MRLIALLFVTSVVSRSAPTPPSLRLPDTVSPVHYTARISADPSKGDFSGHIAIDLRIAKSTEVIWLNASELEITNAKFATGSKTSKLQVINGHENFVGFTRSAPFEKGGAVLLLDYKGKVRSNDSSGLFAMEDLGNKYLFTQFEPLDARDVFPCFDEPSYKVPWQLTLEFPEASTAISNTPPENETGQGGRKTVRFHETKPLPSYLIAFAIGPFEYVGGGKAGSKGVPVRIVTPKGRADGAKYAAEVTATIIGQLEKYFGIPFPYDKADQVAIPVTYGFGAMENPGMLTYAQTLLLAPEASDTEKRRRQYASVAAHELAHQWFGDLVTTAWWNDIWLNEAFATWMEQKILRTWKPEWGTIADDVNSRVFAQGQDSLPSVRKIRQEILSDGDVGNAFDAITYQKGAAVITMFESYAGADAFRKGVQNYLHQYSFRNATAPEFLDSISSASGKNINASFATFLNQPGVPALRVALRCNGNGAALHLEQSRYLAAGSQGDATASGLWQIPVCVRYEADGKAQRACHLMTAKQEDLKLAGSGCPAWVQANDDALGYYRVDYQDKLFEALTTGPGEANLTKAERLSLLANSKALADAGRLDFGQALQVMQRLSTDSDWHVVNAALELALGIQDHLVKQPSRYERMLQQLFGKRAHTLGWIPKPEEPFDDTLQRPDLVQGVATLGGDKALAEEGLRLGKAWLAGEGDIDASMLGAILATTAYYGDKNTAMAMVQRLNQTTDLLARQRILHGLEAFRDPAALRYEMSAVTDKTIPFLDGANLLYAGQRYERTRHTAFDFVRENFAKLSGPNRPRGIGVDSVANLPKAGQDFCTATDRDKVQTFFGPKVEQYAGAPRVLRNVLEGIDVCIARQTPQRAATAAFLEGF